MLSWVVLNFILVINSNASQLTYTLIGPMAVARRILWMYRKILLLFFPQFSLQWKIISIVVCLNKSPIWRNAVSLDMAQNALAQSDCVIFKSNISRAKLWKSLIFCMLIQIFKIKSCLKNIQVDMVISGFLHFGRRTL